MEERREWNLPRGAAAEEQSCCALTVLRRITRTEEPTRAWLLRSDAVAMAQPSASPGVRRRSDGSVRECLFFPVSERNEQERLEALVRKRAGGSERRGGGGGESREPLEHRPKRWTWGGPPDGAEGEYGGRGAVVLVR